MNTGVTTPLWAHQRAAHDFARERIERTGGAMLAMEMRTGKTLVTLKLFERERRILVLCPKTVIHEWVRQPQVHAPGHWRVFAPQKGTTAKKAETLKTHLAMTGERLIVVLNYEAARQAALKDVLLDTEWDAVICDESQRIKAPGGATSRLAAFLQRRTKKRLALTGTPMPRDFLDLYAQARFLDPDLFGNNYHFFKHYWGVWEPIPGIVRQQRLKGFKKHREAEFHRRFHDLAFVVRQDEAIDMPTIADETVRVVLEPASRRQYVKMENAIIEDLSDLEILPMHKLTELLRLQQIANGFVAPAGEDAIPLGEEKGKALSDLLEALPPAEPAVVFCRFIHDLETVNSVAGDLGRGVLELSGRANSLREWQAGEAPILAVQIQAGGVGIDLSRAHYCVFFSTTWSYGDFAQAQSRLITNDASRHVTYYHLVTEDTIDDTIYEALAQKEDAAERLLAKYAPRSLPGAQQAEAVIS